MSHPRYLPEFLDPNNDTWQVPESVIIASREREKTKFEPQVVEQQAICSIANEVSTSDGAKRPIGFERNFICRELNNFVRLKQFNISYNVNNENYRHIKKIGRQSLKVSECGFCKNNGHDFAHILKDELGRVACPRLRKYICPKCHQTGNNAHTVKYCPMIENVDPKFEH